MTRSLPAGGKPGANTRRHGANCLALVRQRLVSLIEDESLPRHGKGREGLAVEERAYAGQVLGQLGDRRPGVGVKDGLPDIDWIKIPAGNFLMGHEGACYSGDYVCKVLKAPYCISRYPITVGQYQAFVDDKGYEQNQFWTKAGWKWRTDVNVTGPADFDPVFQTPNHPRVGVSWFEVVAFCGWLSHKLRRDIRLPSEAEWERAARGKKGRPYPWGGARARGISRNGATVVRQIENFLVVWIASITHRPWDYSPVGMRSVARRTWPATCGNGAGAFGETALSMAVKTQRPQKMSIECCAGCHGSPTLPTSTSRCPAPGAVPTDAISISDFG